MNKRTPAERLSPRGDQSGGDSTPPGGYWRMMSRGWRLRCPRCGRGKLFVDWFRMPPECADCGLDFCREPGFYLGSIYVNYGLTAVLSTGLYLANFFGHWISDRASLYLLLAFCVLFPLFFFRYARGLWLAFDEFWDPKASRPQR